MDVNLFDPARYQHQRIRAAIAAQDLVQKLMNSRDPERISMRNYRQGGGRLHAFTEIKEQFNRRISEISSRGEPLNVKLAGFMAHFSKEGTVAITLGSAPIESGCFKLWVMVLMQGGGQMTLTGREAPGHQRSKKHAQTY
jgi:hypothetical protein